MSTLPGMQPHELAPEERKSDTRIAVRAENVRIALGQGAASRELVAGVSFTVGKQQTVALVGESGSGKSLTAMSIARLTPPGLTVRADVLELDGINVLDLNERQLAEVRGRRVAVIFQNPMSALNPVLTIGRQFHQVLARHDKLGRRDARQRAIELLSAVEVTEPARRVDQYPFELSGGMLQRVMIALAMAAGPDLLIADEPTTALDTTLQAQIMELIGRRQRELHMGLLLISHDLGVVAGVSDQVLVMYGGRVVEKADTKTIFTSAQHPYTNALLSTVREIAAPSSVRLRPIPGSPPQLSELPHGCPFAARCTFVHERCREETPQLQVIGNGHEVACHLADG